MSWGYLWVTLPPTASLYAIFRKDLFMSHISHHHWDAIFSLSYQGLLCLHPA